MRVVDKRGVACSLVLLAFIAFFFWTQSRVPALDEKAQMGQRNSISSLAFNVVYPLSADQSHSERIFNNAVNWAYTNWQGMSFGFLLAASVLTLFSFLSVQSHVASGASRFKYAALGGLFGVPMGVCANCATPIAFGLYRSGLPVPSALALLISSPSFNVIVLMMSLSLLPLELVLIKSAFVLIFILLVVPWLSILFSGIDEGRRFDSDACVVPQKRSWFTFFKHFISTYVQNLAFILKGTLPLMLLAGALAAVVSEFVSLDDLSGDWNLLVLFLVALCATFFPVPIAFDVVISVALLAAGLDIAYVATMFFALGVFSIYPAMMIAKDLSIRLSMTLFVAVVLLAMLAGWVASEYSARSIELKGQELKQKLLESESQSLLPDKLSRPLIRRAARACHALGEPRQYVCFERFVNQNLVGQFSQASCEYLEDVAHYRQICNQTFVFRQLVQKALMSGDVEICQQALEKDIQRCRFDFFFEKSIQQQSLLPCLALAENTDRRRCLSNSLALNVELYPSRDICHSLKESGQGAPHHDQCLSGIAKVRQDLTLIQQGDLRQCADVGDSGAIKSCQVMLISSKMEQGLDQDLCLQVDDKQVKNACYDFHHFFRSVDSADEYLCDEVVQEGLRKRCIEDAIQAQLDKVLSDIRFTYLSSTHPIEQPITGSDSTRESNRLEGAKIEPLSLISEQILRSDLGREFVLKSYELKPQERDKQLDGAVSGFLKVNGQEVGVHEPPRMKALELFEPFSYGRGISAGDINSDLWPDLVLAYADRVRIYRNTGGQFELLHTLEFGNDLSPMLVNFVDLDGDRQLDLFVSFYAGENRVYWNDRGGFKTDRYQTIKLEKSQLIMSAAFQDVDLDGDVDMALGAWFAGDMRHFNPYQSQNYYVENLPNPDRKAGDHIRRVFKAHALPGVQGETLSLIFSDIDDDGETELMIGNDMDAPDVLYRRKGDRFYIAPLEESLPAVSAFNTMSIATGDLNRDAKMDYFAVDMSFGGDSGREYCLQPGIANQAQCAMLLKLDNAVKEGQAAYCHRMDEEDTKRSCFEAQMVQLAKQARQPEYCASLGSNNVAKTLCLAASRKIPPKQDFNYSDYPQGIQRNVLLLSSGSHWQELAKTWGVAESHWSWHSKIADLNNDGWQDIYIGNGYMFGDTGRDVQSNVFFLNMQGLRMQQAEKAYGLEEYLNTPSFVTVDFDRDGDLDIIAHRVAADHGVYINQTLNPGLSVELDADGRSVLGVRLSLRSGPGDKHMLSQTVALNAGGGFLSFDESLAHFGMGESKQAESILLSWPDGKKEQIMYPFQANRHYKISLLRW